jgi:hypothetical protein
MVAGIGTKHAPDSVPITMREIAKTIILVQISKVISNW